MVYLLLMRYLVSFIVWLAILALIILISLFGGVYMRKLYDNLNPIHVDALRIRYWAISIGCYIVDFFSNHNHILTKKKHRTSCSYNEECNSIHRLPILNSPSPYFHFQHSSLYSLDRSNNICLLPRGNFN